MKRFIYLIIPAIILASCGSKSTSPADELISLKKQRAEIDAKIKTMEAGKKDPGKVTPVSVMEVAPKMFNAFIEVQSQITGDENVVASSQQPGTVKSVLVHVGQSVTKGQVLATLDAAAVEQQMEGITSQMSLARSLYEKQQGLWKQNIGSEVQLLTAKTNYESIEKQYSALKAQRDMYRIIAPINGIVDQVAIKIGQPSQPGVNGIVIVSTGKLRADAMLGENYIGKVKKGDPVTIAFPSINDSFKTTISYVAQAVNTLSRSFEVQVDLPGNSKYHQNMSCIMKIANYANPSAIVVPVSLIQKTPDGNMIYVADGKKAKAVMVTIGRNSNGLVEVLTGLNPGDKVITAGFEDMENGQLINILQ